MTELGLGGRSENSPLIANCIIEELIGQGSTSQVYRARRYPSAHHHHPVALKYIDLSSPTYQRFPSQVERFVQELMIYHNLTNPCVIPLLESEYKVGSHIAMVMQLVTGPTLKDTLKEGAWHIWHALSLCRRVGRVLTDLHAKHISHYDVQDSNVMLATSFDRSKLGLPHVYLLDFGLSRLSPDTEALAQFDARPDIYGLSRLMQQILWPHGDNPYPDASRGISAGFVDVLYEASESDTSFKTVEDFVSELIASQADVKDFLKKELRLLGRHGFDSEVLDISAGIGQWTKQPTLPIIPETQHLSDATTQAVTPYFPPQDPSDVQPAPMVVTEHHAIIAVGAPMKPVSRGRYFGRRSVVSSLFSIGLIIGAVGLFIAYLQISAQPPVLDAPIWGVRDGYVALLHPENRALLKSFTEYPASVSSFSANGQYLLAERTVIDLRTGRPLMTFHHAPAPQAVALSDSGKLAALHDGQTLTVWDVKTGDCLHELTGIDVAEVADIFSSSGIERLQVALMKERQ